MTIIPRFQPILDVWTGTVIGYEATMRGERGESAKQLLDSAKQSGAVIELDLAAKEEALKYGLPMLERHQRLFVNVTPDTLNDQFERFLDGLATNRVVIEITEYLPIRDLSRVRNKLARLVREGLEVALDDFGHGFTNLDIVTELPLHYVKLDRSFVAGVRRPKTAETIKGFARVFTDMGIRFIVEGVETAEQRDLLLELGIRYMQGFLFGFPQTARQFSRDSASSL